MISDPMFYIAAVFAVILMGFGKGAFGGGMGVLGVPVLALFLPPQQVAAILLPLLCAMDLFGIWGYRKTWDKKTMVILAPSMLFGIVIGALTFKYLDANIIRFAIGFIAVSFCLDRWLHRNQNGKPKRINALKGGFWGTLAGISSFVAHSGGPPLSVYLLPLKLEKSVYVGTSIMLFTMANYTKLLPYAFLGLFTRENLITSLTLSPLVPLGVFIGIFVHNKIPREKFFFMVYAILLIIGGKLMYDGAAAYLTG